MRNLLYHKADSDILTEQEVSLPGEFTNPFFYTPDNLCVEAALQVQEYINSNLSIKQDAQLGKMFGVLVVKTQQGEIGYLAAFSGNLCGSNNHSFFVPPVFDLLDPDGFFKIEEANITELNTEIEEIGNSLDYLHILNEYREYKAAAGERIESLKYEYKRGKIERAQKRALNSADDFLQSLVKESQFQKAQIKRVEKEIKQECERFESEIRVFTDKIDLLKQERKTRSAKLQFEIFEHFVVNNALGGSCTLNEIFKVTPQRVPPAGAGECAAPKLLQYAYLHNLTPIAMAEFWWGKSPKSVVRVQGNFYPSCKGKCEPILNFMLKGLTVAKGKGEEYNALDKSNIEILYEDEYILAVNKPSGVPSVPGKIAAVSILESLQQYSNGKYNPMLAHRLDMDTSGILLAAKNIEIYRMLQSQFIQRLVHKEYVALLGGIIQSNEGEIALPISNDYDHRPCQKIDFDNGKEAITKYKVVEKDFASNITRVIFTPITGRTHQLRIHSAHKCGLGFPILGDSLYGGKQAKRLKLHSCKIVFEHPVTKEQITVTHSPDF